MFYNDTPFTNSLVDLFDLTVYGCAFACLDGR